MNEESSYPEYIGIADVRTRSAEMMRVEAFMVGQPSLMLDEPIGFDIGDSPVLRGQSRGWTPVHAQLAGLSGCTAITLSVAARDLAFTYTDLATKIRSLIDIRGFMDNFDRRPEFCQVNFDLILETSETNDRVELLAIETERRCPQIALFQKAGIPMQVSWFRAGEAAPVLIQKYSIAEGVQTPEEKLLVLGSGAK